MRALKSESAKQLSRIDWESMTAHMADGSTYKMQVVPKADAQPVAWMFKQPVVNDDGSVHHYSDWQLSKKRDFLGWWPHEGLGVISALVLPYEYVINLLLRMQKHHCTTSLPLVIENYGSREKAAEEGRKLWREDVPAMISKLQQQVNTKK